MTAAVTTNLETASLFQHFIDVALCPSEASAAVKNPYSSIFNKGDTQEKKLLSKIILVSCYFSVSTMPITMTFLFLPLPKKNTPHHKTPPTINSSASNKSLWRASTHITSQDDMPNLLPSALIRKPIFTKMFSSFAGSTAATATPPLQTQSYKTTHKTSTETKKYQATRHKSKQTYEK